ncbi:ABC transporter permease subunit [Caproicibacterium argilliputei]|uniref:ABC transporter permease n=1 Tax=Caproicibacterium sp. XB1 TaxID=3396405 RepID=UPI0023DB9F91
MMAFTTRIKSGVKPAGKHSRVLRWVLSAAFWLLVWQAAAMAVHEEILLVTPLAVARRLAQLARTETFWLTVIGSMLRILLGFLLAMALGTLLAAATSRSSICYTLFYPVISIIKATPVASFIILALVWFSSAKIPIFTSFLIAMPLFWQNVSNGIASTDRSLLEMASVYRFGRLRKLTAVYVPSVLPYFSAACSTGIGMAWKAGVAAEVLANTKLSVGGNLYDAKIYLETPDLFAWTAAIVILSVALEKGLGRLLRRRSTAGMGEAKHDSGI